MTAALLLRMQQDLSARWGIGASGHAFLMALQACAKARLPKFMAEHAAPASIPAPPAGALPPIHAAKLVP